MSKTIPARYHPFHVTLHWLIVLLITAAFLLGRYMSGLPNEAAKVPLLAIHMSIGLVTLVVMVVRLIVRLRLPQPAPATAGNAFLDAVGKIVHWGLYAIVFLLAVSGISLGLQAGLLPVVFGGSGGALPADFFAFRARAFHGLLTRTLLVFVALHIGAVIYHAAARRENLLRRMWYGK
jgi:cytochrome b561